MEEVAVNTIKSAGNAGKIPGMANLGKRNAQDGADDEEIKVKDINVEVIGDHEASIQQNGVTNHNPRINGMIEEHSNKNDSSFGGSNKGPKLQMSNDYVLQCDPDLMEPEWAENDDISTVRESENSSSETPTNELEKKPQDNGVNNIDVTPMVAVDGEAEPKAEEGSNPEEKPINEENNNQEEEEEPETGQNVQINNNPNNLMIMTETRNEDIAVMNSQEVGDRSPIPNSPFSRPEVKKYVFEQINDFAIEL